MIGIKSPNTYAVEWQELVTYKIEVKADSIEEAQEEAWDKIVYLEKLKRILSNLNIK